MSRIAHCPHGSTNDPRPKGGLASRSLLAVDLVERSRDLDALRATKVLFSDSCRDDKMGQKGRRSFFSFRLVNLVFPPFYLKWDGFLLDIVISIFSRIYLDWDWLPNSTGCMCPFYLKWDRVWLDPYLVLYHIGYLDIVSNMISIGNTVIVSFLTGLYMYLVSISNGMTF